MTKQPNSEPTIGNLTREQLEEMIEKIARKTFQQEMGNIQEHKSEVLAATFGAWEDEKTESEIIEEIYDSRNSNLSSI